MKKNSALNQNMISLQETTKDNFEAVTDGWSIAEFNQRWKDYWYSYFSEQFKNHVMFKKILELEEEREYLAKNINKIVKVNEQFFNENIELGKLIDDLKHELKLKNLEITDLRKKIGKKPKGFFDATSKLIGKNIQVSRLLEENEKLKGNQNQASAISANIVEQILVLRVQGLKFDDIAKKTGVSTATVSRYIRKNKERLRELESSAKSDTSF